MAGVSIEFFTKAIRILEREHGHKMCGSQIEEFRAALAEAERIFLTLPDAAPTTEGEE